MIIFGVGYILFDHLLFTPVPLTSSHVIREAIFIGTLGPTLVWLLLTWATRLAQSRQETKEVLKRRALQLETASQVSQKVTAILEVEELLTQVVHLIQSKFGYYQVHLFLVEGHTNEIVLRECTGETAQLLKAQGLRFKIGGPGITSRVAQTGQPILCNNVAEESSYYPHELLPNINSEVAIPLKIGDVIVGVLDVQSEQLNAFQEDDLTTLQILSDQIAIAIENAKLFQ
jgi:GAF domain-containing protein